MKKYFTLFPINNEIRKFSDLSGVWNFKLDRENKGSTEKWFEGFSNPDRMSVPCSFQDIMTKKELRDFVGDVYYQKDLFIKSELKNKKIELRFGQVAHRATIYLNGKEVIYHDGGFTTFAADITDIAKYGESNTLVVKVNNELTKETLPLGDIIKLQAGYNIQKPGYDFFNYSGINSPVYLVVTPKERIEDITLVPSISGDTGVIDYKIESSKGELLIEVLDQENKKVVAKGVGSEGTIKVPKAKLWQVKKAYLYNFRVTLLDGENKKDVYTEQIGIRTIELKGSDILINNKKVYLKGFSNKVDMELKGYALDYPSMLRDLELLDYVNANSIRANHQPYPEEFLRELNRKGLLVIEDTPAFTLGDLEMSMDLSMTAKKVVFFDSKETLDKLFVKHSQAITETMQRDKNYSCIIMWTLMNEPAAQEDLAPEYFERIFKFAKEQDPQRRPLAYASGMHATLDKDKGHKFADVIFLNRLLGWLIMPGTEMRDAKLLLEKELQGFKALGIPVMYTRSGADAVPGIRKSPSASYTEEYQADYYKMYTEIMDKNKDAIIGEHLVSLKDYATTEAFIKVDGTKKGAFTRTRAPKNIAVYLKERWNKIS